MKRFIGIILCIACFLAVFAFPAYAEDENTCYRYYYGQLSEHAKMMYDAMRTAKPENGKVIIEELTQNTFTTDMPAELTNEINAVAADFQPAIDALLLDDALMFWLELGEGGTSISYTYSYVKDFDFDIFETYYKHTITVFYNIVVNPLYANAYDCLDKIDAAADEFTTADTETTDILKDIHDFLCEKLYYDTKYDGLYSHTVYGALCDNGKCVCEGYAKAFKLLCDRQGIKCVNVFGDGINSEGKIEAHMWNYVEVDGDWYAVDVTWDDQSTVCYDYFLSGYATEAVNFGGSRFDESHVSRGDYSGTGLITFLFPEISETAFDFGIEPEPAVPELLFLMTQGYGDGVDGFAAKLIPGIKAGRLESSYGSLITVTDENGNELADDSVIYTGCYIRTSENLIFAAVVPGDINGDGYVDACDYILIKRCVLGFMEIDGAYLKAADTDCDDSLEAIDYLCLKRYLIGTNDLYTYLASVYDALGS